MTFSIPTWWEWLLLSLAVYRLFKLLADDTILDRPRHWLVGLPRHWKDGDPIPSGYRYELATFLQCPWCAGAWCSLLVWLVWQRWPHQTLIVCSLLAISAVVGLLGKYTVD